MPEPEVTVVIPTHNRSGLLPATLHSVLRQENVSVAVVIVDDGSTDQTEHTLRGKTDNRVRWCRLDQTVGVSRARNTGLAMVNTTWVAFTDDDDLWAPRKLACQLDSLAANPRAAWSYVGSVVVDGTFRILRHEKPPPVTNLAGGLLAANGIPAGGSGVVARTELVRSVGCFDPCLSNLADWDLWIRLALAAPATAIDRPLVAYRLHSGGMAHGVRKTKDELETVATKYAAERAQRGLTIDSGTWFRYFARMHLRRGDRRAAAADYFRAGRAGRWTRFGVGMLCLTAPDLSPWADRRSRLRVPRTWAREAAVWLAELEEAEARWSTNQRAPASPLE